jgi:hypothetical protein
MSTPFKGNSQLEVVGHEKGGLIANDERSMAACMQRLIEDPALRSRLSAQGRDRVLEAYSTQSVVPTLIRICELALAASSREDLRSTIEADKQLVSSVDDDEMEGLMRNTAGSLRLWKRLLGSLSRTPAFARTYYGLQRRRGRFGVDPLFPSGA